MSYDTLKRFVNQQSLIIAQIYLKNIDIENKSQTTIYKHQKNQ